VACRDRVDQGVQLRCRERFGPCLPPALQRDRGESQARNARSARGQDAAPTAVRRRAGDSSQPGAVHGFPGSCGAECSWNQASQQKLKAQLTRAWWRRIAAWGRTWKSAQPSWSLTCL
jgi:hypothetical protein